MHQTTFSTKLDAGKGPYSSPETNMGPSSSPVNKYGTPAVRARTGPSSGCVNGRKKGFLRALIQNPTFYGVGAPGCDLWELKGVEILTGLENP